MGAIDMQRRHMVSVWTSYFWGNTVFSLVGLEVVVIFFFSILVTEIFKIFRNNQVIRKTCCSGRKSNVLRVINKKYILTLLIAC